jgi:hypothetical protein
MPAYRASHPVFARFFARASLAMDAGGIAERRRQLLQGLTGTVIEIGAGNGLNFAHYPAHVRADTPGLRRLQRLVDATIWPAIYGGCHTGRDTAAAVQAAGFTIEQLDRFRWPEIRLTLPISPHLSATAYHAP